MGSSAGRVQGEPQPESQFARGLEETADRRVYAVLQGPAGEGRDAFHEEESERADVDREEVTATEITQVRRLLAAQSRVTAATRSLGRQSELQSASGKIRKIGTREREREAMIIAGPAGIKSLGISCMDRKFNGDPTLL